MKLQKAISIGWYLSCASVSFGSAGTEGNAFLTIPVGAGPASLGSAYTASATDAYAPVWNPAGLGFVEGFGFAAQHLAYVDSIRYEQGSIAYQTERWGGFGASVQYLTSGDIPQTNGVGDAIGSFSTTFSAYTLAYGNRINQQLAVGGSLRTIRSTLADVSAVSYSGDVGLLWRCTPRLQTALTAQHLGPSTRFIRQKDAQPTAYHAALSYRHPVGLTGNLEVVQSQQGATHGRVGAEASLFNRLLIRGGYRSDTIEENNALAGLTVGMGVRLDRFEFAYAWVPLGDLGFTQYFSITGKFGSQSDPEIREARRHAGQSRRAAERMVRTDDSDELYQLLQQEESSATNRKKR